MEPAIRYIVDDKGHKTSVLVPVKDWDNLNSNYESLVKKLEILTGIQDGINEVKESKKKGKSLQTLSDFLSEDNS